MAVGGPPVISGNAAPLKWRPFSSCFNLGPLLQRCISLLSISCLAYLILMTSACAHMCTCLDSPPSPVPCEQHSTTSFPGNTCVKTKDGRNGGPWEEMTHIVCLITRHERTLCNYVVIHLLGQSRSGPRRLLLVCNSTLQALTSMS